MTTTRPARSAIVAMYAGLGLTVVATIAPYVDRAGPGGLAGHIRAGYPDYPQARVDAAVNTYLIYLSVVGVLGIACWLGMVWAVKAGKRWAGSIAAMTVAVATVIAVTDLVMKDTSGDTGLPPLLGWLGLLPSLAGCLAVGLLLRKRADGRIWALRPCRHPPRSP